jgi:hypothetical protein
MNTPSLTTPRPWARALAVLSLAAGAWALSGTAQARDNIHWSIGVHSPGVSVGVSNAPTVVYSYPSYGYPVYHEPRPVVVYPRPVVVHPRPVVVHSYPVYAQPHPHWHGHRGHKHGHRKHHRGHRDWHD